MNIKNLPFSLPSLLQEITTKLVECLGKQKLKCIQQLYWLLVTKLVCLSLFFMMMMMILIYLQGTHA